MTCKFCRIDPDIIVLVPNKDKGKDGYLEVFACLACSRKEGLYCDKHERPHTGFMGDNTTACLFCIEEEVQARKEEATEVWERLRSVMFEEAWEELREEAEISSVITGDDESLSGFRFIVTAAHRHRISSDEIVNRIVQRKSAVSILPRWL
jgi:hypothetical protein